jgi:hypothetical protein
MCVVDATSDLGRLERSLASGVPADAVLFYGRWFQLETWLREVVYVELRAKYGPAWQEHLEGRAPRRAAGDARNAYMASADADDVLAYADVGDLFALIEAQWPLFDRYLLPRRRWAGRSEELRELRNRNAHCRRPHRDDVARLEQTLRDLEGGAWLFYSSYVDARGLSSRSRDPVARAWLGRRHEVAGRLVDHAARQYDVRFRLRFAARPWATMPRGGSVSGLEGLVWHAEWILGDWEVSPSALGRDIAERPATADLVVHLLLEPTRITATFSALDDPPQVADAIGVVFDSILVTGRPRERLDSLDEARHRDDGLRDEVAQLPARVQTSSPMTLVDPTRSPHPSIFGA